IRRRERVACASGNGLHEPAGAAPGTQGPSRSGRSGAAREGGVGLHDTGRPVRRCPRERVPRVVDRAAGTGRNASTRDPEDGFSGSAGGDPACCAKAPSHEPPARSTTRGGRGYRPDEGRKELRWNSCRAPSASGMVRSNIDFGSLPLKGAGKTKQSPQNEQRPVVRRTAPRGG